MHARLPGPDVTTEQLRERSWWHGPQLFVRVDDYDLVAGSTGNPVALLLELLPQARDIGLHLVLARRTGGASRALYEPVTTALRDLGSPGILLSGDREEGPLHSKRVCRSARSRIRSSSAYVASAIMPGEYLRASPP